MNPRHLASRILTIGGGIAMAIGAIDPLEGSLAILPGIGLMALGTYLSESERPLLAFRVWAFVLVAIGVGALWGLSAVGGFGGQSGRSIWWGLLILPYLVGWNMGIWGPGSPRWLLILGAAVGLWYLSIPGMILIKSAGRAQSLRELGPLLAIGSLGLVTLCGCIGRWIQSGKAKAADSVEPSA